MTPSYVTSKSLPFTDGSESDRKQSSTVLCLCSFFLGDNIKKQQIYLGRRRDVST